MFDFPYRKSHYLTHPWRLAKDVSLNLKWAWQRVYRGYDDRATWSIDYWLCEMLPPMLIQLGTNMQSYPEGMQYLDWRTIIFTIASGFESMKKIYDYDYDGSKEEYKKLEKKYNDGMELFVRYFHHLWD